MLKKITIYFLVFIFIVVVGIWLFALNNKPVYNGSLSIIGLHHEVEIYFDEVGVPHIYAQDEHDAYLSLGYVHAQDRLWQMEVLRRIAAGRLAEIFGSDLIKTDKYFRGIGINEAAKETIEKLDTTSQSYILSSAYLNGINQFIKNGSTPVEFRLLGIKKENYTHLDVLNVFGYLSFGFAMAHLTDPLLTDVNNKLGSKYLKDLGIQIDPRKTVIPNYSSGFSSSFGSISGSVSKIVKKSPVPLFIGSNSWVIGTKKTHNKKVIFANDPHIEFAQPAVWYQSHLITPDFEMYGFNLALMPFPLLGHNRNYAFGLTMFENDDIDFYQNSKEEVFSSRREIIIVKGDEDVSFEVKEGKHGPVMNGMLELLDMEEPISMDWIYTKIENEMLDVSYGLSHANSLKDFKKTVSKISAPGLNVMYGDKKDNIAWFASAKLYKRKNIINTKLILDGSDKNNSQIDYLEFSSNPQAINPPWNYVYSANNQPTSKDGSFYPGYYLPEDRAKRIIEHIKPKNDFTIDDVKAMVLDVQSTVIPELISVILDNMSKVNLSDNEKKAVGILKNWKGDYRSDEVAPTIYVKLIHYLMKNTFEDEMGEKEFIQFLETHLYLRQISKQIKMRKSIWWDNINTREIKENRDEIFTSSFHEAITSLELQFGENVQKWTWDKALTVTHKHAFDKVTLLKNLFNVGPFTTNGGNEVLNNQMFTTNSSGIYEVHAGPSTRRLIDFSDVENGLAILPTGQSGNVFSKHYKDQAKKYLDGEFVKMMLNKEEIQRSEDKLILKPMN